MNKIEPLSSPAHHIAPKPLLGSHSTIRFPFPQQVHIMYKRVYVSDIWWDGGGIRSRVLNPFISCCLEIKMAKVIENI